MCQARKTETRIRPQLEVQSRYYSVELDESITEVNDQISSTHRPDVAAEATRMRDDLRETKSILDSIDLR
jgi:hypothetical protein